MIEFEWDNIKALSNIRIHGIDFTEVISVFLGLLEIKTSDPIHSICEYRFIRIGKSNKDNLLAFS